MLSQIPQVGHEIARRNLAVVRLEYSAFCSPVPSSFIRIEPTCLPDYASPLTTEAEREISKETQFEVHDRFLLNLMEPLGDGAVGVVHPAIVEFTLQSGEKVEHNLAFSDKQHKGLMNEYRIYRHLSGRKGVKGIPTIHGVFRDPELNTLGMLMSDAGRSLRHREKEKGPKGRKVSGKQKYVGMPLSSVLIMVSMTRSGKPSLKRYKASTKLGSGTTTSGPKIC